MEDMPVVWRNRLRLSMAMDHRLDIASIPDHVARSKAMSKLTRMPWPGDD
jgi:hypothetical protein